MDAQMTVIGRYAEIVLTVAVSLAGSVLSIILHEISHGFSAYLFGDTTARDAGRLSLNPVKHVDLLGTVVIPLACYVLSILGISNFFFGWAKPVPVDPGRMRRRKAGMITVSLSGVTVNLILGGLFYVLYAWTGYRPFANIMIFNAMLFAFNVIPFPPLDGFNFVMSLLPERWTSRFRVNPRVFTGIFIVLMLTGVLRYVYLPVLRSVISLYGALFGFRVFL